MNSELNAYIVSSNISLRDSKQSREKFHIVKEKCENIRHKAERRKEEGGRREES